MPLPLFWWTELGLAEASGTPALFAGPTGYLPKWVRAVTDPSSLLGKLLRGVSSEILPIRGIVRRVALQHMLVTMPVDEPRCEWYVSLPFDPRGEIDLRLNFPDVSGSVRRAETLFEYWLSPEPVWWTDQTEQIVRIRNPYVKRTSLVSSDGTYSIGNEPDGLVPDQDILWIRSGDPVWFRIDAESPMVSGTEFSVPVTGGYITVLYGSMRTYRALSGATVTLYQGDRQSIPLPLNRRSVRNLFDAYGDLIGIPRIGDEDNRSYKKRLLAEVRAPIDTSTRGVSFSISSRLGRVGSLDWDGTRPLVLDATGASGIREVYVVGTDRFRHVWETLDILSGSTVTYSAFSDWWPGWLVLVNGVPATGATVSGNKITFDRPVSGRIDAIYSVETYRTSGDASGNILVVVPKSGMASGAYFVLYSRDIVSKTIGSRSFLGSELTDPSGLPTRFYFEIAGQLVESNPVLFGRGRWGSASWSERVVDAAPLERIPVPFDSNA